MQFGYLVQFEKNIKLAHIKCALGNEQRVQAVEDDPFVQKNVPNFFVLYEEVIVAQKKDSSIAQQPMAMPAIEPFEMMLTATGGRTMREIKLDYRRQWHAIICCRI